MLGECLLYQRTRQLEDFQQQMVLVVETFRRYLRPCLSYQGQGLFLCGSYRSSHSYHGGLDTIAPCPEERRAEKAAFTREKQELQQSDTVSFRACIRLKKKSRTVKYRLF